MTAQNPTARILGPDSAPVTGDEVARRPISAGLLARIVLGTAAILGATFTFGSKWGGSSAAEAELRGQVSALIETARGLEGRLRLVEESKTRIAPAVENLTASTNALTAAVNAMQANLAGQTVEIRLLHEAVSELRASKSADGPK